MSMALMIAAAIAVRNPFWPIGYEGVKEVISPEPRVETKQLVDTEAEISARLAAALAKDATVISKRHWIEARKLLRVTGSATVTDKDGKQRLGLIINGNTYGDGDFISINHEGRRFTWRILGFSKGGSLKLQQFRAKLLDEDEKSKGEKLQLA